MPSKRHTSQRNARADIINARGINMSSIPCARCHKKGLACLILKGACRCGECHRSNVVCEIDLPSPVQWDHIKEKEYRLNAKAAKATQEIQEPASRLLRVQREQAVLNDRVAEMLRRDADSLEELEEIERLEAEAAKKAKNSLPDPDPFGFLGDVGFPFDPETLAYLGVPQASQGSDNGILPASSGSQPGSS